MICTIESSFRTQKDNDQEVDANENSCDDFVPPLQDSQLFSSTRDRKSVTHPAQTLDHKATNQRLVIRWSALGVPI
jgi:hypothetical protein